MSFTLPIRVQKKSMQQALGPGGLFSIGYGNVGSSIYYALGVVAASALGATPIAFGIAGLFFVFTALTYAEGAAMFPESGGSSTFARHAFNEFISFVAGWALMLDYIVTIAISAYTTATYSAYFWEPLKNPQLPWGALFAILLTVLLCILNIRGVKDSALVNNLFVLLDVFTQASIILMGSLLLWNWKVLLSYPHIPGQWPTMHSFIYSVSIAMVAFTGIESVAQMAEEAKEPQRTVPKAVLFVIVAVLVMYAGINGVAFSALSPHALGTTYMLDPVQGIAHALGMKNHLIEAVLRPWIAVLAASILIIATNAGILGVSRLAYSMGTHRQLPGVMYKLHPTYNTPYVAILFYTVITVGLLATGFFTPSLMANLADLYSFGAMLAFVIAHCAIIGLRWKRPDLERYFKLPFNLPIYGRQIPLTAILGVISTFATWLVVVISHPWGRTVGFLWLGMGILMYAFHRQHEELPLTTTVTVTGVEPLLVPMALKNILVPTIGTPFSEEMVAVACRLSKRERANVRAIYIYEVPMSLPPDAQPPAEIQRGQDILTRALQIGEGLGVNVDILFLQGRKAGEIIVEEAERMHADVILMGLNPSERLRPTGTIGRTVDFVLKKAPCRVLLNRPHKTEVHEPARAGGSTVSSSR
ncbi:MAG: universal stress protein [Cyanobacteria bacterium REEB65]|nr:universal stress protein [Cyanobacteria bacterium REEB65]